MKLHPTFSICMLALCLSCNRPSAPADLDWAGYLGGPDVNQYSLLKQINKENVDKLEVAWVHHTGDRDEKDRSQIQCNPLIIGGVLYGTSPMLKLFALNAATGEEIWRFDPFAGGYDLFGMGVNRGLAYWTDGTQKRIFFTAGAFLFSVRPEDGTLDEAFGDHGRVDLHDGLGRDVRKLFIGANTPGIIYKDLLIQGTRVSEAMGAAPGHIRAYDVRTGKIVWTFHTIPEPGEYGYETWPKDAWKQSGGANSWAGFSLDLKRGIVFVPTGSAAFDFYGGDRHGDNLFANCLIALNAATGERIWHFQTVHHDLWDRDLPMPPNLITVNHNGRKIDAVAQPTKSAFIFLFDRETGEPLFPIKEVPVMQSSLEGEKTSSTQPIPTRPPQFARGRMTEQDITNLSPEAHAYVKTVWEKTLEGEPFVPPSEEGSIIIPGFDGGGEWGGAAFDPETGNLIVNASEMAWIIKMNKYDPQKSDMLATRGKNIYEATCVGCHGPDLKGSSIFTVPSLVGLKHRLTEAQVSAAISNGQGMMPSFAYMSEGEIRALTAFLLGSAERVTRPADAEEREPWKYPYTFNGYARFKDQNGYPAITPPWGTLNAVNLNTGEISWKVTLGTYPGLEGVSATGSESYGGPVVTAGGVVFIAATLDEKIRAFDKDNGKLLWEASLPAAGFATPATYALNGKQYVVIACGGGKLDVKSGDAYVAFALPDTQGKP